MALRTKDYLPVLEQIEKEGRPLSNSASSAGLIIPTEVITGTARQTYTAFTTGQGLRISVPPGETWIGAKFKISVDRACLFNGSIVHGSHITQSQELGGFTAINGVFPEGGGTQYIDAPPCMYESGYISLAFSYMGSVAKPAEAPIIAFCPVGGFSVVNDHNFAASGVVLCISDSIGWAGERIGFRDNSLFKLSGKVMFPHLICDALRKSGRNVRLVNKGFGSMVQEEADYAIENGYYDGIDYDLLLCSRGTNDVPTTITTDAENKFKASLKKVIQHRDKFRPNASIVFIAPFPSDAGAARVANLGTVRTWVQEVANDPVLGGVGRKVYYYNGGSAFTLNAVAANDVNFAQGTAPAPGSPNSPGERVTGQRLHLGEAGHLAAFNGLWPVIQTTQFYTG